ncbi:MAG: cupin-like domain-containing protein [Sphingomonas sp.]
MTAAAALPRVVEVRPGTKDFDPAALVDARTPVIFKGLAADWPMVREGRAGDDRAMAYLERFDGGRPVVGYTAAPAVGGRYFYTDDVTAMNFTAERVAMPAYFERIRSAFGEQADKRPSLYIGSTDLDTYLPGFRGENDLRLDTATLGGNPPTVSIWIGNRTVAATHYDMSNNIACCLVGRRRFTLFPPDQVANLYPGPLEPTPGGQVVSMVELRQPDLDRYPRFAAALAAAQVAELEPGDVLFYPALWWHNVEALDDFNVMVNYWWNPSPRFMDTPMNTILHGLLSLRDRPTAEKEGWRALFDYYLFGDPDLAATHLPAHARGPLAPIDATSARRLRAQLLHRLNR